MVIYRSGDYSLTLPDHLKKELEKYQQRFTPEDTEQVAIENFLAETGEKFVCVRVLFHEALGHPSYDEPKKSESNRISTIMHHMPGWEAAGIQRCGKYGSARTWSARGKMILPSFGKEFFLSAVSTFFCPR